MSLSSLPSMVSVGPLNSMKIRGVSCFIVLQLCSTFSEKTKPVQAEAFRSCILSSGRVLWIIMQGSFLVLNQHFGETCCLYLWGWSEEN
jgi:hypothetical protein